MGKIPKSHVLALVCSMIGLNNSGGWEMAYIQAYSLLSDPEYINIVYICLHANYLNKILFKPIQGGAQWLSGRVLDSRPRGRRL